MPITDGLAALPTDDVAFELDGLDINSDPYSVTYYDGIEGFETDTSDGDTNGDGATRGYQRLTSKAITLGISVCPADATDTDRAVAIDAALHELGLRINPLADRTNGTRVFRWRLYQAPAKRLLYRADNGQALTVPGDEARVKYDNADVIVRIEATDPVVITDVYTDYTFTAGQTRTIPNAGNLAAVLPTAYQVTASGTLRLQNLDSGEDITYPSPGGALTVSRTLEIHGTAIGGGRTWGLCNGPDATPFPRVPLLYPGDNTIKASAACTLRVWSTST